MNDQHRRGPKVDWKAERRFENDAFIVQLNKLPLRFPRFSVAISAKLKNGKEGRFIAVRTSGQGKIEVHPIAAELLDLLEEAENYVQVELQVVEDRNIDRKIERETRRDDRGRPQETRGLKKLGEIDRRRARRDRDTERDQT